MRSYILMETNTSSAVWEIFRYRHTQIILLLYKNILQKGLEGGLNMGQVAVWGKMFFFRPFWMNVSLDVLKDGFSGFLTCSQLLF